LLLLLLLPCCSCWLGCSRSSPEQLHPNSSDRKGGLCSSPMGQPDAAQQAPGSTVVAACLFGYLAGIASVLKPLKSLLVSDVTLVVGNRLLPTHARDDARTQGWHRLSCGVCGEGGLFAR
jgi:hypothetical protein